MPVAAWIPAMAAIGQLVGGAGQLAGGLGIGAPDQDIGKGIKHSIKARLKYARYYGDMYGFNPLTALGVQPQAGPWRSTQRLDLAKVGRGLEKGLSAGQRYSEAKAFAETMDLDNKYKKLRNEQMQMENLALWREMNKQPGMPGQADTSAIRTTEQGVLIEGKGVNYIPAEKTVQAIPGVEAGYDPFFKVTNLPDGGIKVFPTKDNQELTSEGFHALEYGIQQTLDYLKGISTGQLNTTGGIRFRNDLRKIKRHLDKSINSKLEYRFNPYRRAWYVSPNKNRLFDNNKLSGYSGDVEPVVPNMRLKRSLPRRPMPGQKYRKESWYFD